MPPSVRNAFAKRPEVAACIAAAVWCANAGAQTPAPPAGPTPAAAAPAPRAAPDGAASATPAATQAAMQDQIAQLRSEQEAALAKLRADQDAALARMQAEHEAALAALAAKQAELDRRLSDMAAEQVARDRAAAETEKARAAEPAPGVALSLVGTPVRIFGNLTLRYDYSTNSNLTDTLTNGIQANWLLLRARLGAEFGDTGPVTGGLRLSSGENQTPTVPFVTLSDAFRPSSFGLDLAWASLRPLDDRDRVELVIGRMKNPFWRGSIGTVRTQMLWDDDVNPAGAAIRGQIYKTRRGPYPFVVENALAYMQVQSLLDTRFIGLTGVVSAFGDQVRFLSKYVDLAVAYYEWWNLNTGLSVPTSQPSQGFVSPQTASSAFLLLPGLQRTNTIENYGPGGGVASGFIDSSFQILNPTAEIKLPSKNAALGNPDGYVIIDYSHNFLPSHVVTGQGNLPTPNPATCKSCTTVATSSDQDRNATRYVNGIGVTVGARLGDNSYQRSLHPLNVWGTYRYVQADATLSTFADSDLGAGTDYNGFGLGANYRVFKNFMAQVQYFDFWGYPLMENHVHRLFLDLMGDF